MLNAVDFKGLDTVRTEVLKALPVVKRDQPPAHIPTATPSSQAPAPSTASAFSPAQPSLPAHALPALAASHTLPSSPASSSPPAYDVIVAKLYGWASDSLRIINAAAAPLPHQARALLYCNAAHFQAFKTAHSGQNVEEHYILSIRLQQVDNVKNFSFPLVVVPHSAAHTPWRPDILDEPLSKYRPHRFASESSSCPTKTILVKHALLMHVADLFVRPFGFPLGSLVIDPEDHNMLVYIITIPDGFDRGLPENFLQSFLCPAPQLQQKITKGLRSSTRKTLESRDPFCPVTLVPFAGDREAAHMLDHNMSPCLFRLIAQELHEDAKRTGRYGTLIQPWDTHDWSGDDIIHSEVNQALVVSSLVSRRIDRWAFLVLLDKTHNDDAVCADMHQGLDLWHEPEPEPLPAVAFLHWAPDTQLSYGLQLDTRRQLASRECNLSGVTTLWHNPSDADPPASKSTCQWPRPPNWFPAHPRFPPPFLLANTLASRIVRNFASYAVDGFAMATRNWKDCKYGGPGGDSDYKFTVGRGGGDDLSNSKPASDSDDWEDTEDESPVEKSTLDDVDVDYAPVAQDTLAILSLALLSLAATYATVLEPEESDSDDDDSEDSDDEFELAIDAGEPLAHCNVRHWLPSVTKSGEPHDLLDDIDMGPTTWAAPSTSHSPSQACATDGGEANSDFGSLRRKRSASDSESVESIVCKRKRPRDN